MAYRTPRVSESVLRETAQAEPIALDTPAWFAWLADEGHRSFHFAHALGDFTARKERKQRGQHYWVAYRQAQNMLHKRYLGKSEALTAERLVAVAAALAQDCSGDAPHDADLERR